MIGSQYKTLSAVCLGSSILFLGVSALLLLWGKGVFAKHLKDFIFPPRCLICRERVDFCPSLCGGCWGKIHFIDAPKCLISGRPFSSEQKEGVLDVEALRDDFLWESVRAAVLFGRISRHIVHRLKYHDQPDAGLFMGCMMWRAGRDVIEGADALVAVPLSWQRVWSRRYNHAQVLVDHLSKLSKKPVFSKVIKRVRSTKPQVGLSHVERKRNVQGAFALHKQHAALFSGKKIILVDDVVTTGATAEACAELILKAGAVSVSLVVFGVTIRGEEQNPPVL